MISVTFLHLFILQAVVSATIHVVGHLTLRGRAAKKEVMVVQRRN